MIAFDRASGLRATADTPPEQVVQRVYAILPPEAQSWAREQGIPEPPPNAETTSRFALAGAADQSQALVLTSPDAGAIYRLDAVLDWLSAESITPAAIHAHALTLQEAFVDGLSALDIPGLAPETLVVPLTEPNRGNFLTFRTPEAGTLYEQLLAHNIITDHRGDRLRFGFGIYQDEADVAALIECLKGLRG